MILPAIVELLADPTPAPEPTVASAGRVPGRPSRATALRSVVAAAAVMPARWQPFADCVIERESGGSPTILNAAGSGAAGLAQWMPAWRSGLPYVLARALKAHGATPRQARTVRLSLPHRIEQWPERYQRAAFAQILVEGGRAAAMRHWFLAGSRCNRLAAS